MGVASASSTGAENTEYTQRTDESAPPVGARGEKNGVKGSITRGYEALASYLIQWEEENQSKSTLQISR